nr:chromate transporter [Xanthobacter dioxanivorans]
MSPDAPPGIEPAHPPASPSPAAGRPLVQATILEIFLTFLLIGATSFGGGVVAYLRNALVVQKGWLDEEEFLTALEISQALPGLNATNMSVIVGDRLRGPVGAVAGFLGMTLPGDCWCSPSASSTRRTTATPPCTRCWPALARRRWAFWQRSRSRSGTSSWNTCARSRSSS